LVLDPSKRLSAKEALEHKVFKNANDKINIWNGVFLLT
jgi:hypothetical protein